MSLGTVLDSYLSAAAATMSAPPCTAILQGEPDNVTTPTVARWYIGTKTGSEQTWAPNTLNQTQEVQGWRIRVYLPIGPRFQPSDGKYEDWIVDFTNAIRGQLYGHVGAGGQATGQGMELTDALPGYSQPGGQLCRIVTMDWWAMLSNVHPIAV